ncbi:MAG: CBS domain-containing protein [Parvibaculaceae bacterium]
MEVGMNAVDVMVRDIVTVDPEADVKEAARLLVDHDISALPVVNKGGELVGIISEADLVHRAEIDTIRQRPWWLEALMPAFTLAADFAKSHGKRVEELMSTHVISASEQSSLSEIASLLERHRIKRVPIVKDGKVIGIVSRNNLVQALASTAPGANGGKTSDRSIRLELLSRLSEQAWTDFGSRNVIVGDGIVHLWGLVGSEEERKALIALAETVPGVVNVSDETILAY